MLGGRIQLCWIRTTPLVLTSAISDKLLYIQNYHHDAHTEGGSLTLHIGRLVDLTQKYCACIFYTEVVGY